MKNSTKKMYTFFLSCLVLASACKKNDLLPANAPEAETTLRSSSVTVNGTNAGGIGEPNALLDISEPLFNEMIKGTPIEVVQSAPNTNYVAVDVIKKPGGVEPLDPCSKMIFDINEYTNANMAQFVEWANQHCTSYIEVWKDPNCSKKITITVKPTEPCGEVAYENPVKVFDRL